MPFNVLVMYSYVFGNFLIKAFLESESNPNINTFIFKAFCGKLFQLVPPQMSLWCLNPVRVADHVFLGETQET